MVLNHLSKGLTVAIALYYFLELHFPVRRKKYILTAVAPVRGISLGRANA